MILSMILGSSELVRAEPTITQVTSNAYQDVLPDIKDKYLVWQGWGHLPGATSGELDWEVFLFNVATKEMQQITDNDYDDLAPQTDGSYIVWQGFDDGEWDIFLWDGGQVKVISNRGAEDVSPKIAAGFVVWTSLPFGDGSVSCEEVMLYDVGSETLVTLSQEVDPGNIFDDGSPEINDEVVIWTQTDKEDGDNAILFVYDRSTESVAEDPGYRFSNSSQTDGALSVLTRHDGTDREVFLYTSNSKRYHQITNNSLEDTHASISGNYVTWVGGNEIFLAKVKYLFLIAPGNNGALFKEPPPVFSWEAIGYDTFKIQFSGAPDFPTGETLSLPSGEGGGLSVTSLAPTEEEWQAISTIDQENGRVYWRVEAKSSDGSVSYTEMWSFTIDERVGSAGIAKAAKTDDSSGDGGGGGKCFIDTVTNSLR
jgi:hypothetical protein